MQSGVCMLSSQTVYPVALIGAQGVLISALLANAVWHVHAEFIDGLVEDWAVSVWWCFPLPATGWAVSDLSACPGREISGSVQGHP